MKEADSTGGNGKTILLVEDNVQMLEFLISILTENGYRILVAANAEEALKTKNSNPGEIDLLLTDLMMPGQSGKKLYDTMHAESPNMKVLFMSGFASGMVVPEDVLEVIESKASLLEKPFLAGELLSKIEAELKG